MDSNIFSYMAASCRADDNTFVEVSDGDMLFDRIEVAWFFDDKKAKD